MDASLRTVAVATISVMLAAYAANAVIRHAPLQKGHVSLLLSDNGSDPRACVDQSARADAGGYFAGCGGFF